MTGYPSRDMAQAAIDERIRTATEQRHARQHRARAEVQRIVRAAANGDAAAWDWLVSRFHRRLVGTARGLGLGHHDAEDAAQATWFRLARHIKALREPGSLPAWLHTAVRREGLRIKAKRKREQLVADFPAEAAVEGEHDVKLAAAMRSEAFAHALSAMPERHRELMLTLAVEPPLSYAEIATRLNVPIGSIGPIRRRCLDRLRTQPAIRDLLGLDD